MATIERTEDASQQELPATWIPRITIDMANEHRGQVMALVPGINNSTIVIAAAPTADILHAFMKETHPGVPFAQYCNPQYPTTPEQETRTD